MTAPSNTMRPSALGLIVLGMLIEEPMHVYRMQKLIKERGKAKVVNVRQRTSLHQILDRLTARGLVDHTTQRDTSENYPERRVYSITAAGRQVAVDWLTEMVTGLPDEFPQFPAALSVLTMIGPDAAAGLISARIITIETTLEAMRAERVGFEDVPRVYLLEDEYRTRNLEAEAAWLAEVLQDIRGGVLTWQAPEESSPGRADDTTC
ncbi:PadR family transcriptional regulator [Humibacter sp. RRB41]|uniref:PadR family transcriptional regulator n=1 Tax=Humibacter sp. RRB41 TaxID=2919946 RepID=UPI001FA966C6|nr:PadR family transcriptional regulator [Humibacter sp. RRB41]